MNHQPSATDMFESSTSAACSEPEKVEQACAFLRQHLPLQPKLALVLGSGLGPIAERMENATVIPYQEIPHFPVSTAIGHAGRLLCGRLAGIPVLLMAGRVHHYEGYSLQQVVFPARVLAGLGVEVLVLTNAAGGINTSYQQGALVLIGDHINFLGNPLIGANHAGFGLRFPDMSQAYDRELRRLAHAAAAEAGVPLSEGVYVAVTGPSYETPAEIHAFRVLGADLVGMSTVPEVIAARHRGMRVLAISMVTNMAAGILDQEITAEEVIETGQRVAGDLDRLLARLLPRLAATAPAR